MSYFKAIDVYEWLFVFVRLGPAILLFPGFGDTPIPGRVRVFLIIVLTVVITPMVTAFIPKIPISSMAFHAMLIHEMLIGIFIGIIAKLLMTTLETTGNIISMMTGLSNASLLNPTLGYQSTVIGAGLNIIAINCLLATDVHHQLILALTSSYSLFVPGGVLPIGDFSQSITTIVGSTFSWAVQLAAPFLILGLVWQVVFGLVNRLVPQIQVFMVATPAQLLAGLILLLFSCGTLLLNFTHLFLQKYQNTIFLGDHG